MHECRSTIKITYFIFTVVRFDPISYMVTEGVNNVVTLMLFRTGNTDLTAPVNITTVFGTASGKGRIANLKFMYMQECSKD